MVNLTVLLQRIADLKARVDKAPTFRWATVTAVGPLRIQLDPPATVPEAGTPDTLINGLNVGDRVGCLIQNRRVVVIGKGGG